MGDGDDQLALLRQRVERLEAQMAFLQRSLGVSDEPAPEWRVSSEVADLISRGERKEAVRLVREQTGASLKDAMRIVDGYRGGASEVRPASGRHDRMLSDASAMGYGLIGGGPR